MKLKTSLVILSASVSSLMTLTSAHAAIALDRTRVVFPGSEKSVSLTITNDNTQLPYLAQSWIENDKGEKISSPMVVLPPVQRVEPGAKSIVKIQSTPALNSLPQDRETLFYFNLREIPPRAKAANTLQIALQTKVKLFYRPAALLVSDSASAPWQVALTMERSGNGYKVHNPTAYYVTINNLYPKGGHPDDKFKAVMVAPKSDTELDVSASALGASPQMSYINDYGGRPTLSFNCAGSSCKVAANKVDG